MPPLYWEYNTNGHCGLPGPAWRIPALCTYPCSPTHIPSASLSKLRLCSVHPGIWWCLKHDLSFPVLRPWKLLLPLPAVLSPGFLSFLCLFPYCCDKLLCSVTKPCSTLCNAMNCSMPGFPVLCYVSKFAQIHVLWVNDAILTVSSSAAPFSFCL